MEDVSVGAEAGWVCQPPGPSLDDVLLPVHLGDEDGDEDELDASDRKETKGSGPVLLERVQDGSPCVLTLLCGPAPSAAIRRLLVVSEARTVEVYDGTGEYRGTARGAEDRAAGGPFYRKQLTLDPPAPACSVKLLSLAGRSSVRVCRVVVGLRSVRPGPDPGPGIDLRQVRTLVDQVGTGLSPGAQNLLDMVQVQQKNRPGSLGGFLPLLMGGGALSALAGGLPASADAGRSRHQPADVTPADRGPALQNGGPSADSAPEDLTPAGGDTNTRQYESSRYHDNRPRPWCVHVGKRRLPSTAGGENGVPASHAHLAEVMSRLLKGRDQGLGPELLPVLQSVCGQVTRLRLDQAAERTRTSNGTGDLDPAMEQRLEEMERRLKEHVDRRLDALEQKLEKVLLSALSREVATGPGGGASEPVAGPTL